MLKSVLQAYVIKTADFARRFAKYKRLQVEKELLLKEAIHYQEKTKVKKLQIRGDLIPTDIVQSNFQARETGLQP